MRKEKVKALSLCIFMGKLKVYYIESASQEYFKHGRYFPREAFEEGDAFRNGNCNDSFPKYMTCSKSEALKYIRSLTTDMHTDGLYLWVVEWAIVEHLYDIDAIKEDFPEIRTKDDILKMLKEHPWSLEDYDDYGGGGNPIKYSKREYEACVWTDEDTYIKVFSDYYDALDWIDKMEDEKYEEGIRSSRVDL